MHLKFPYFTYLHLSRTITRIACKILSCTRNLLRKVIKKKKIPRFVEFTWLQTDVTCSMRSSKIGKTEKSDTAFEESCERIRHPVRFDLSSFWKRVRGSLRAERLGRPRGQSFPDCNWEQSEWRSKRSAAKHERRVIQLAKSVDTQERQPAADDNCQR